MKQPVACYKDPRQGLNGLGDILRRGPFWTQGQAESTERILGVIKLSKEAGGFFGPRGLYLFSEPKGGQNADRA